MKIPRNIFKIAEAAGYLSPSYHLDKVLFHRVGTSISAVATDGVIIIRATWKDAAADDKHSDIYLSKDTCSEASCDGYDIEIMESTSVPTVNISRDTCSCVISEISEIAEITKYPPWEETMNKSSGPGIATLRLSLGELRVLVDTLGDMGASNKITMKIPATNKSPIRFECCDDNDVSLVALIMPCGE